MRHDAYLTSILAKLKELRCSKGITTSEVEERLILGKGWVERFENAEVTPSFDMLLAILQIIGSTPNELFVSVDSFENTGHDIDRSIYAEPNTDGITVKFRYANHIATYDLNGATIDEYEFVIKTMRDRLSLLTTRDNDNNEAIKTDAVASAFLCAVNIWPNANPSDLWWFIIYRAYCDPFNHPASYARLDFSQSWKRTGGWALEEVLVRHYGDFLISHGVKMFIANSDEKEKIVQNIKTDHRMESDKMDVVLAGVENNEEKFFGVVHVKASFAERRTDDVPMSHALVRSGYTSPLWTMDCKSIPSNEPYNKGELGKAKGIGTDRRSAKRKDIEDEGYFSNCFSYNNNTTQSPPKQKSKYKIIVCDFKNKEDEFSKYIIKQWKKFKSR